MVATTSPVENFTKDRKRNFTFTLTLMLLQFHKGHRNFNLRYVLSLVLIGQNISEWYKLPALIVLFKDNF